MEDRVNKQKTSRSARAKQAAMRSTQINPQQNHALPKGTGPGLPQGEGPGLPKIPTVEVKPTSLKREWKVIEDLVPVGTKPEPVKKPYNKWKEMFRVWVQGAIPLVAGVLGTAIMTIGFGVSNWTAAIPAILGVGFMGYVVWKDRRKPKKK